MALKDQRRHRDSRLVVPGDLYLLSFNKELKRYNSFHFFNLLRDNVFNYSVTFSCDFVLFFSGDAKVVISNQLCSFKSLENAFWFLFPYLLFATNKKEM